MSLLFWIIATANAYPTWKESRKVIFSPSSESKHYVIQPGQSIVQKVDFDLTGIPARRFLRVVGGLKFPAPFDKRGETMFRASEYLIDDNLDSLCISHDRYSLYFKGSNDPFERVAFHRIPGHLLKGGELTVSLPVLKKEALKVDPHGWFGLKINFYYNKNGRDANDIYDEPDSVLYVPVVGGSEPSSVLCHKFSIPDHTACILLQLGGKHFSGECWLEAPRFYQQQREVCKMPFTTYEQRTDSINYWVGCNLSTRSWPRWKLESNGRTVFEDNIFDRASNVADFYIQLPDWVDDHSKLTLSLMKEGQRAAFPYEVHRLELIEETARNYEVVAYPSYVTHHSAFGILVETNEPDVRLQIDASGEVSPATQECYFKQPGLHVVEMRAGKAGDKLQIHLSDAARTETLEINQVIDKGAEHIYVSSGDEIYIDKQYQPYNQFFKWYMHNRVGNWYHFRPSYQWSGFRVPDTELIKHYIQLLNQLQMPYAWQVEGRTLAGKNINPSLETLDSPLFYGKQAHENDGGYCYWTHFKYEGLFSDLAAKNRPYGGIFAKHRPIVTNHGTFIHYDTQGVKSMADGARQFVENLHYSKGESTRHTGPSSLFRYFYQAGYEWLGAEQMYGPEETILSSLRGASKAYNRPEYGTLHAMQWSSGPFSDPKHSLRMYLSLALAYMHGSSHMNTEEALWTDEYSNDRYSEGGKEHLFAQHQVLDFVETHTRRGKLTSRIAVIQGRNDAWRSFVRGNIWSQQGEQWKFDAANESFDLMNVFYPKNILNAVGPHGWFTDTPHGTVDLLPIEASREVMADYKAIIFLGWNSYDKADFERLYDYVCQGGTLLLSAAHINEETLPNRPTRFPEEDDVVRRLLGPNYKTFTKQMEIAVGNGKVIYFPQSVYPADLSIRKAYETTMRKLANEVNDAEPDKGWITHNPAVGFTVWDHKDRRTIYLLNTDWKSREDCTGSLPETHYGVQPAVFVYGDHEYPVQVRRYHIETIHCAEGVALLPLSNTSDVLRIDRLPNGWKVRVQTTGPDRFNYYLKEKKEEGVLSVDKAGIIDLFIQG